jgi:hypothetical protein
MPQMVAVIAVLLASLATTGCGRSVLAHPETSISIPSPTAVATPTNTPEEAVRTYYQSSTFLRLNSLRACCPERALEEERIYAVTLDSSVDNGAYQIGENYRFVRLRVENGRWVIHLVSVEPGPRLAYPTPVFSPPVR